MSHEFPLCHVSEVVEEGLNNQLIVQENICLCVEGEHRSFDNNPLLEQVLFGSSGPVLDELKLPHTFVLLDAALHLGLPEVLENEGIPYSCLFFGDARDELADVAPYIAQVSPEDAFLRKLLTGTSADDPPWMMWPKGGFVFLRSGLSLDNLVKHFRKFTRIFDMDTSRWNFFRFYAPETMLNVIAHMEDDAFQRFANGIDGFMVPNGDNAMVCLAWHEAETC